MISVQRFVIKIRNNKMVILAWFEMVTQTTALDYLIRLKVSMDLDETRKLWNESSSVDVSLCVGGGQSSKGQTRLVNPEFKRASPQPIAKLRLIT